jgi:hypothetical protein
LFDDTAPRICLAMPFSAATRPRASLPQAAVDQQVQAWLEAGGRITHCPPAPAKPEMWDILENLRRRMPPEPKNRPRENAPLFNPPREEALRRMWPEGVAADDIAAALNRMEGPHLTVAAIRSRVGTLKLRRPADFPKGVHAHRRPRAEAVPIAEAAD